MASVIAQLYAKVKGMLLCVFGNSLVREIFLLTWQLGNYNIIQLGSISRWMWKNINKIAIACPCVSEKF